ncbi:MAG: AAA family ATPase [Coprococcus catus]|nr:AAA family ATPase [Coprococcus catus]
MIVLCEKNNLTFFYIHGEKRAGKGEKRMNIQYIIDQIDEVVAIFDHEGVVYMLNEKAHELLPFDLNDVLHKNVQVVREKHYVDGPTVIEEVIQKKDTVYRNILYNGNKLISYTGNPAFNRRGEFVGGVLTGRDMSLLMKLYHENEENSVKNEEVIGKSKSMLAIKQMIRKVAKTDVPVFITGESGVGKEVVAQAIWKSSRRADKPCISINCAAIPSDLIESELFGYEEGAFTGAKRSGKKGLFEKANGGTVFLDEIGELPKNVQSKLLRVIQEKELTHVGGSQVIPLDIRFISATNLPPEQLRSEKYFRQDLYFRLSVIPIAIPPLRERREDIIPLADYFLDKFNDKYKKALQLSQKLADRMKVYDWNGNVRELRNVMERLAVISNNKELQVEDFEMVIHFDYYDDAEEEGVRIKGMMTLEEAYRQCDQILIPRAMGKSKSANQAAEMLNIDRSTLYRKMKNCDR